jgi:hypothetical protein
VTRVNSVTGVAYRDDPTIFAWELINEPRVPQDSSGNVLQARARARLCVCCTRTRRALPWLRAEVMHDARPATAGVD